MSYQETTKHDFDYFEEALLRQSLDFSATYMTLKNLGSLIDTYPHMVSASTIDAVVKTLDSPQHTTQKMSLFLFRDAAELLVKIILYANSRYQGYVISNLLEMLGSSQGDKHRAIAEAIGIIPVNIKPPPLSFQPPTPPFPLIPWKTAAKTAGVSDSTSYKWYGRSLTLKTETGRIAVFKFLRNNESPDSMAIESNWLEFLEIGRISFRKRFEVPSPVKIKGSSLFFIEDFPFDIPREADLSPCHTAICFIATKGYFSYPNDASSILQKDKLAEVISRNAYLLGRLTSQGIIHTAPIPLFHNRTQKNRRGDMGVYIWSKGGRLDQWLASCIYPNFGISGLRDFEHLEIYKNSDRELYRQIGSHILSLILVAGSYFRIAGEAKKEESVKLQAQPKDTRAFFDKDFFSFLIQIIYKEYYKGFTEQVRCEKIPFDPDMLAERLIEEMGVDNHMEEVLRAADQNHMTDEEYKLFLKKRGFDLHLISSSSKGEKDIVIYTGPHLGGFNGKISVPELIEALETLSAYCIAGRFFSKNKGCLGIPRC